MTMLNAFRLDTTAAPNATRCSRASTSCNARSPKQALRRDDIEGATVPRPRHHPVHAFSSEALGCAHGWPNGLRSDMHEVRPNLDGELGVVAGPLPGGPAFLLPSHLEAHPCWTRSPTPNDFPMTKQMLKLVPQTLPTIDLRQV